MLARRRQCSAFKIDYAHWVEKQTRQTRVLRAALQQPDASELWLSMLAEGGLTQYDRLFRAKSVAANSDAFFVMSGVWRPVAERFFPWIAPHPGPGEWQVAVGRLRQVEDAGHGGRSQEQGRGTTAARRSRRSSPSSQSTCSARQARSRRRGSRSSSRRPRTSRRRGATAGCWASPTHPRTTRLTTTSASRLPCRPDKSTRLLGPILR